MRIRQLFACTARGVVFGFSMPAGAQEILPGARESLPGVAGNYNSARACDAARHVRGSASRDRRSANVRELIWASLTMHSFD